jgi:hypothetical protein
MNVALVISDYDHRLALDQASKQALRPLGEFDSAVVEDEERWLSQLWSAVRDAILESARVGYEAARKKIAFFETKLTQAAEELGERIDGINAQLTERLNRYLRDVIEQAFARFEPEVSIGGKAMALKSLTLEQSFKLSSSLSVSISTICQFVAEGQVAVSASYEAK